MNIVKRSIPKLKRIVGHKKICGDVKNPTFYCWFGHTEKRKIQPEFKYKIILKKNFSTDTKKILCIDIIGVTLVGVSQII